MRESFAADACTGRAYESLGIALLCRTLSLFFASLVTDKGEAMPDKDIPQDVESSHCMI